MKVVILAAGKGSRLMQADCPKPLVKLSNGKTILQQQLENLSCVVTLDSVIVVVGYQKEKIMTAFPDLMYVYNPSFESENTAKSLLRALKKIHDDVLWLNGDVVFKKEILKELIAFPYSCMMVNQAAVGDEEIKYQLNSQGKITSVSKLLEEPLGEAVGINLFKHKDLDVLKNRLERCKDSDYFEKAIEMSIQQGVEVFPVTIGSKECVEVDFPEDLIRANKVINDE